jgi:TM2 domain-containing membrane protein YozV
MKLKLLVMCCFIVSTIVAKNTLITVCYLDSTSTVMFSENISFDDTKPNPIFQLFRKKRRLNKRITAAVLAFPFPFGIVGLHRIYLGTKPYVPVAYIASLGGVFGILPLIDFFAITFDKDLDRFRDNGKVFMWIKE